MPRLRVLVAEDSPTARRLLVILLSADPELEVVGEARNGAEAIEQCKKLRPDLVTMDIKMPVMDGVEATRRIMIESATPVVMVSSLDPNDVRSSMRALEAGALAVLAKPAGPGTPRFVRDSRELVATIKAMAQVKLVRRWPLIPPYRAASARPDALAAREILVVGLVSSTGGPNALRSLLSALPADFAPPIMIVQHIAAGFAQGLAEWLTTTTKRTVTLASDGERFVNGGVYVAPDDRHLEVSRDRLHVTASPPVEGFRPSGTRLFSSLAAVFGPAAIGVIMTGMGHDGVAGLLEMRDAGSAVLAQDEASCDIFGMPGAAVIAGAVTATTPLSEIPTRLVELVAKEGSAL
ncbi:MAG TPA: chemotaxis-specific protein-glutamate methyltransferase CheB [Kofleriaceae bacterium]|nr:chemotaxis-specific protein-glutamate methyltransferase CheB [Kofleriaceae bacterium]